MGTTNFVRWASGSSAQLMPIEKYQEQAVVGLVPGIADLEQANRAWFQSTAIACAIAELIVTAKGKYAGVDLSDSESNSEIADKLVACFSARIPAEIAEGAIDATKIDLSKFPRATDTVYGTVVLATEEEATTGSAGKVITADVFKKSVDKITGGLSSSVTYTEQSLGDPQKAQARKNIDAVSSKELEDGLVGKQDAGDYPTRSEMNSALGSIRVEFQTTIQNVDLNSCKTPGVYHCKGQIRNIPPGYEQGTLLVTRNADGMVLQQYWTQTRKMWMRQLEGTSATEWKRYGNNFTASTTDLTAGSSPLENDCFYFVYE